MNEIERQNKAARLAVFLRMAGVFCLWVWIVLAFGGMLVLLQVAR